MGSLIEYMSQNLQFDCLDLWAESETGSGPFRGAEEAGGIGTLTAVMFHGDLRVAGVGPEEIEHGLLRVEHVALHQSYVGHGGDIAEGGEEDGLIFQSQLLFAGGEAAGEMAVFSAIAAEIGGSSGQRR